MNEPNARDPDRQLIETELADLMARAQMDQVEALAISVVYAGDLKPLHPDSALSMQHRFVGESLNVGRLDDLEVRDALKRTMNDGWTRFEHLRKRHITG